MIYRKRQSIFDAAEHEWRITPDSIVVRDSTGFEVSHSWREAASVELSFAPTQMKPWRYRCRIVFRDGARVEFDNAHFEGIADFEDRSASYSPFVREALARISAAAPDAKVHVGYGATSYTANVVFVGVAFAFLAAILVFLPLPLGAWPVTAIVKLALIASMLPLFFRWLRWSRPRDVPIAAVPDDALPRTS
jgi:hypothetical protein